jgi:putative oxidoreductase
MERQETLSSIGLLVLRLGAGGYMAMHGWEKLQKVLAGDFRFADPIGIGEPASLVLAAGAEFGGALLVVLGLWTRLAALPVVFTMAVAAFVRRGPDPWYSGTAEARYYAGEAKHWFSKEPALMFLCAFAALALIGAGRYSLDGWLARRRAADAAVPPA